ncbi:MAG: 4a-hydroxytetrahydrobiopterin dehydratase, partial [Planctomycetota bacterium]
RFAFHAEDEDHHPDLHIGYRSLTVRLSTHSANGVTGKDTEFVEWIDSFFRIQEAASLFKNPRSARQLQRVMLEALDRFVATFNSLTPDQLKSMVGKGKRSVFDQAARTPIGQSIANLMWIRGQLALPEPQESVSPVEIERMEDPAELVKLFGILRGHIEHTLGQLHDGIMSDRQYLTNLGGTSDIEQMLQRTIVDLDRHRHLMEDAKA